MAETPQTSLTRTYATALYELAVEREAVDSVLEDLRALQEVIGAVDEFGQLMASPAVSIGHKEALLDKLFAGRVHPLTGHFLKIVCRKERMGMLAGIIEEVLELERNRRGAVRAVLTTAVALDSDSRRRIADQLGNQVGRTVELVCRVDADLIGGMTLEIGGMCVDGSVKNRLRRLTRHIVRQMEARGDLAERFTGG